MKALRTIKSATDRELYLTFDDGPDAHSTPAVRRLLAKHGIPATFFMIAQTAREQRKLVRGLIEDGHAIGNHSLDHGYRSYFLGKKRMREWIIAAERIFSDLSGEPTVGFRPPAGIRTPELHSALADLRIPLVLWSQRSFDTVFPWTTARARSSIKRAKAGEIVLLHDRKAPDRLESFLSTLDFYFRAAKDAGVRFRALRRAECIAQAFPDW